MKCPICQTEAATKHGNSPYWICPNCDCWFQWPQPPKLYIADFEGDPTRMSDHDMQINKDLAGWLFREVMKSKPGHTLDIGAKLPVLAHGLFELGCKAYAVDATTDEEQLKGVRTIKADFEKDELPKGMDLITLIHTFEHLYDPLAAIRRLRLMLNGPDSRLFLRLPQHDVAGFERDLTDGHYSIHPFYHSLSSILECLKQTEDCFVLEQCNPMNGSGQSDLVLRPI